MVWPDYCKKLSNLEDLTLTIRHLHLFCFSAHCLAARKVDFNQFFVPLTTIPCISTRKLCLDRTQKGILNLIKWSLLNMLDLKSRVSKSESLCVE